jgi:hypothetical protein
MLPLAPEQQPVAWKWKRTAAKSGEAGWSGFETKSRGDKLLCRGKADTSQQMQRIGM